MAVINQENKIYLSNDELNKFSQNGYTADNVKRTIDTYRSQGVPDTEILNRMNDKLSSFNSERMLEGGISNNVDLTPSGLLKAPSREIAKIPYEVAYAMKNKTFKGARDYATDLQDNALDKFEQEHPVLNFAGNTAPSFGVDIAGYMALPEIRGLQSFRGANLLNKAATGAYQGGTIGFLDNLKNKGFQLNKTAHDTGMASLAGATINTALGASGKMFNAAANSQFAKNAIPKISEFLNSVPAKYSKLAIEKELQNQSILSGKFNQEKAYRPIEKLYGQALDSLPSNEFYTNEYKKLGDLAKGKYDNHIIPENEIAQRYNNVAQRVAGAYDNVLQNAELQINEALGKLPSAKIDVNRLKDELNGILSSYANGSSTNPVVMRAGQTIATTKEWLNKFLPRTDEYGKVIQGENMTPMDLHNFKEILYDIANYEKQNGINNSTAKVLADKVNQEVRNVSLEYSKANDTYSALRDVAYDISGTRGIKSETLAPKLYNYSSSDSALRGVDDKLVRLEQALNGRYTPIDRAWIDLSEKQNGFIPKLKELNSLKAGQEELQRNISSGMFNNISAYNRPATGIKTQLAMEKIAPEEVEQFLKLQQQQSAQKELLKQVGREQYLKNPKLLTNFNDEGRELALEQLQQQSGVNFMDELNSIRAREAFEKWMPGQGGGSGSDQGAANLIRNTLLYGSGAGAFAAGNPLPLAAGFSTVSPRISGKGFVRAIGAMNNAENTINNSLPWLTPSTIYGFESARR